MSLVRKFVCGLNFLLAAYQCLKRVPTAGMLPFLRGRPLIEVIDSKRKIFEQLITGNVAGRIA